MNTTQTSHIKQYNTVCAFLMVVLIVLQFVPFWELDGQRVSICGYIWLPLDYAELTAHFTEAVNPDFTVDSLVLSSLLQLVVPATGIALFLYNRESVIVPYCTAAAGLVGVWPFLSKSVFRLGMNWQIHFTFATALLVAAVITLLVRRK